MPELSGVTRITLRPLTHRGQAQARLDFLYDRALKDHLKRLLEVRWSRTHQCFYIPLTRHSIARLLGHLKGRGIWVDQRPLGQVNQTLASSAVTKPTVAGTPISPKTEEVLENFAQQMQQQRYSASTIRTYGGLLRQFFRFSTH